MMVVVVVPVAAVPPSCHSRQRLSSSPARCRPHSTGSVWWIDCGSVLRQPTEEAMAFVMGTDCAGCCSSPVSHCGLHRFASFAAHTIVVMAKCSGLLPPLPLPLPLPMVVAVAAAEAALLLFLLHLLRCNVGPSTCASAGYRSRSRVCMLMLMFAVMFAMMVMMIFSTSTDPTWNRPLSQLLLSALPSVLSSSSLLSM